MSNSPDPSKDPLSSKQSKYDHTFYEDDDEECVEDSDEEEEDRGKESRKKGSGEIYPIGRNTVEGGTKASDKSEDEQTNAAENDCEETQDDEETNENSGDPSDGMMYFLNQLKQVNGVISDLLYQLATHCENRETDKAKKKKGGFCGWCRSPKEKDLPHIHQNIDKVKGSKCKCCLYKKSENTKVYENCILCQLLSLQERVDNLLDQNFSGSSEQVKALKDEQAKLHEQVNNLITECDGAVLEVDEIEKKFDLSSLGFLSQTCSDDMRNSKNDDKKGYKLFGYNSDSSKNRVQESVFLNCVNELVILVKSMNCISSPGTFWQKRITNGDRKKPGKCCQRDYPHMHGELNGVPIIIKLHRSKKRKVSKQEEKIEQVVEEPEFVEEEDIEQIDEEGDYKEDEETVPVYDAVDENKKKKEELEEETNSESETESETDSVESEEQAERQYSDELEYAIEVKEDEERSKYNKERGKVKKKSKEGKDKKSENRSVHSNSSNQTASKKELLNQKPSKQKDSVEEEEEEDGKEKPKAQTRTRKKKLT